MIENVLRYSILKAFILLLLFSCEKKPVAEFKTDKNVYSAGDTVKLTNTSPHGSSFIWTMPDGQIQNTKNALYVINPNSGFDQLTISLSSKSKGHCKRSFNSTSIKVIPRSWFSNSSYKRIPSLISLPTSTNNFIVSASYSAGIGASGTFYTLGIFFPAGSYPPAGNYTLQTTNINLTPFTAMINLYGGAADNPTSTNYVTGLVQVEYVEGTLHVYFANTNTYPSSFPLSASIYYII